MQTFWFCLIAVLWGGYFVLEGFDFGVGMLLPFVPRDETDREVLFTSIGPFWDGNEVWLVVAAGATFAAFPAWYSTMFSGMYIVLLLVLVLLIVRAVSFEWRSKSNSVRWRSTWTAANVAASYGAPFLWGLVLANLLHGAPLAADGSYVGSFGDLFSFYTVFAGIALVGFFAFHGATFLTLRTEGALCERAARAARRLSLPAVALGAAFVAWTIVVAVDRNDKNVYPVVVPAALAAVALAIALVSVVARRSGIAFTSTVFAIAAAVATLFTGLYPRVFVSAPSFDHSLTIANAASAHYTLEVLTVVALIVTPVVLLYQAWTYRVFRARVTGAGLESPAAPARTA
jgi:cytochrome d ubiquinol oxidase subunit II